MTQALTKTPFVAGYIAAIRSDHPEIGDAPFAPETLARVMEDCGRMVDVLLPIDPSKASAVLGAKAWTLRQAREWPDFPPLTLSLGDDGKVVFQ